MIKPIAGYVRVLRTRVRLGSRAPWAAVGYLVENPHSYPELTVRENQEVTRRLHSGTPPQAADRFIERQPRALSFSVKAVSRFRPVQWEADTCICAALRRKRRCALRRAILLAEPLAEQVSVGKKRDARTKLAQQRRQAARMGVVCVADGYRVDCGRIDAEQLEIVCKHSPALASVEVDALAGCLDQVGQPVLAPAAGTGLNCVVNQAGESHAQPLSKPTSAPVVDFRPPFDSLRVPDFPRPGLPAPGRSGGRCVFGRTLARSGGGYWHE
jgi:hypothetical protein